MESTRENLNDYLCALNIKLPDENLKQFEEYKNWLVEWNEKINLTAITDSKGIYTKHFYDSLTISKIVELKNKKILDIGSGAGFPGLALKIFEPSLELSIIEGNSKKVRFLKALTDYLQLTNVNIINGRAEVEIEHLREEFDIVTARAVSKLNILSELCLPFVKVNGYFIAMKGINYQSELDGAKRALSELNGEVESIEKFLIPHALEEHHLLLIKKVNKTPLKYPRAFTQIKNKPL